MTRHPQEEIHHVSKTRFYLAAAAALVAGMVASVPDASAVSTRVKLACAKDYYAHCSKFAPGSPEVRSCMRAVGDGLSPRCVNALVADGEVSQKEVAEHSNDR